MAGSYVLFICDCKLEEPHQVLEPSVVSSTSITLFPAAHEPLYNSRQQKESVVGRTRWESCPDLSGSITADMACSKWATLQKTEPKHTGLE